MNGYALVILFALLFETLLSLAADLLNLKNLKDDLPTDFLGIYDPDRYRLAQEYLRENTRFGLVTSIFDLAVVLSFWLSGGFNFLDIWVRGWGYGSVMTGLIYAAILIGTKNLLTLPFQIYAVFVIEERFGFNKTTPATFVKDTLKGFVLAVVLGGSLLACVLSILESAGGHGWIYCWMATTVFILAVHFVAPTWLLPWFNKFDPLEEGALKSAIMSYARSVKFPLENVFIMDGSRRSTKSNAFFTGFGRHRRIALFDTLITQHTVPELVAVLAHEIGHYKKKHVIHNLLVVILHVGIMFLLLSWFITRDGLFQAFYMEHHSVYAGLIFFGLLFSPAEFIMSILIQIMSRQNESEADRFAIDTTGDADSLAAALKKISAQHLSNLTPHPLYVFLNYSHPPILERIKAMPNRH
ncbi:MAG: M48 family metallopeptidase [Deltaproteobacteria bacterium]|nr:M48 family metallopeptidase [Deltaproteobacteria bacterium]